MVFKKINLEYYSFTEEDRDDIKVLLKKGLRKTKDKLLSLRQARGVSSEASSEEGGSLLDPDGFLLRVQDRSGRDVSRGTSGSRKSTPERREFDDITSNPKTTKSKMSRVKRRGPRRREQHLIVMDLFLALILCHNVTPVFTL